MSSSSTGDADLAYEAGKNATDDAKGNDILLRYRQLLAQKNAEKAMWAKKEYNASATPEPVAPTPAVSTGSSGGEESEDSDANADDYEQRNKVASTRADLTDDLNAEQAVEDEQTESSSSSSSFRRGGSDKENMTPPDTESHSSTTSSLPMSEGPGSAPAKRAGVGPNVVRHHTSGKKYFVSKKALALDEQWAMVGATGTTGTSDEGTNENVNLPAQQQGKKAAATDDSDAPVSNGVSELSTSASGSSAGDADKTTGRVQQDNGELLSATGVSFLDDVSFLDTSDGQVSLDLSWKNGNGNQNLLSPVAEGTVGSNAVNGAEILSKTMQTFTPGSLAAAVGTTASSLGIAGDWDTSTTSSIDSPTQNKGVSMKDASMWVLPANDESDETLSNAPSDETSGSEGSDVESITNDSRYAIDERKVFAELSAEAEKPSDEASADFTEEVDDECVRPLTPNRWIRKNAIDQALEETTMYVNKIQDLESALEKSRQDAEIQAQRAKNEARKRHDCERKIDELLLDQAHTRGADYAGVGSQAATPLLADGTANILNESAFISPHSPYSPDDASEDEPDTSANSSQSSGFVDARAATASLMERNQTLVKEIRFADQTCVELSERNAALMRDVDRLTQSLDRAQNENDSFREQLGERSTYAAKLEERQSSLVQQLSDQSGLHQAQMNVLDKDLKNAKLEISNLCAAQKQNDEEKEKLISDLAAVQNSVASKPSVDLSVNTTTQWQRDLENAKLEVSNLQEALKTSEEHRTTLLADVAAANAKAKAARRREELNVEQATRDLDSARNEVSSLRSVLKQKENERSALIVEVEAAEAKCAALDRTVCADSSSAEKAEKELRKAEAEISSLQIALKESEEERSALVADVATAKAKIGAMEKRESESSSSELIADTLVEEETIKNLREERDALLLKCSELEAQQAVASVNTNTKNNYNEVASTPEKPPFQAPESSSSRTPTSTVLAKTLQSQLERGNSVEDRAREAEKTIVSLQMQLEASQAEAASAVEEARELRLQIEESDEYDEGNNSSLIPGYSFAQDLLNKGEDVVDQDAATAVAGTSTEKDTVESTEIKNLRSQLHEALYDKKALLLEISTYQTSVKELELQLDTQEHLSKPLDSTDLEPTTDADEVGSSKSTSEAFRGLIEKIQYQAEQKIAAQQDQIARLSSNVLYLQSQLDFESASTTTDHEVHSSFTFDISNTREAPPKESDDARTDTDAVMNATFATSRATEAEARLERCEQGWATPGAASDNIDGPSPSSISLSENERHRLRVDITELRSQLEESHLQLQLTKAELHALQNEASDTIEDLELRNDALEDENQQLQSQIDTERSEAADMLNNLERKNDSLVEENNRLALEVEHLTVTVESAQSSREDLRKASGEVLLNRATISNLKLENDRLRNAVGNSSDELNQYRSDLESASSKIISLEEEQGRLESEIENVNAHIEAKAIENDTLKRRCDEQITTIEQYRALRLDDAKTVEDLRDALKESTAQANTLKQSFVTSNDKLANAMDKKMDAETELQRTQTELEQSRALIIEKDAKINELTTRNEQSQRVLENEMTSALRERDQEVKESEKAMKMLQQEISLTAASIQEVAISIGIRESYIEEKAKSLKSQRTETTSRFSFALPSNNRSSSSRVTASKDSLTKIRDIIVNLNATIASVREKIAHQETMILNIEREKEGLFRSEEQVKAQLEESQNRERNTNEKLQLASQELTTLVSKLALAETAAQDAHASIRELEKKVEAHKKNELILSQERDSASARMNERENSLVDTLVRQREESSSSLKDLKERLSSMEAERTVLSKKNESLDKKCSRLREYVKNLTEKCQEWSQSYRDQSVEVIAMKEENEELTEKVSRMRFLVEDCPDCPDPSCSSCVQLRSVISAQCQVRAALLKSSPENRS